MHPTAGSFRLGPYDIVRDRCQVWRDGERVRLPRRTVAVFIALADAAGALVTKEDLIATAWAGHSVSDDSLFKAIADLRQAFERHAPGILAIETERTEGYRLTVENRVDGDSGAAGGESASTAFDVRAALEPFLTLASGRAMLESLNARRVDAAADAFAGILRQQPRHPGANTGMAHALFLQFEASRAHGERDWARLERARQHALVACESAPHLPHPWGALASTLLPLGQALEAEAAARKAVALGAGDWRHRLRLASVCSGTRRLEAALEVLAVAPDNPLADWMASTVYIARERFPLALDHISRACAHVELHRTTRPADGTMAVGVHLQHGLILKALGDRAAARTALERERALADAEHVYTREACANACYALAALHFEEGDVRQTHACLQEALARIPGHGPSLAVLRALGREGLDGREGREGQEGQEGGDRLRDPLQRAIERAITASIADGPAAAAAIVRAALQVHAAPGPGAAWILPVEPFLNVAAHREVWADVLAVLHELAAR